MINQFLFLFFGLSVMIALLAIFVVKAGLQLQYLRLKNKKEKGSIFDFLQFDISDSKQRKVRMEAFLLFPVMFAVVLDEDDEELNNIKRKVKRLHIAIYLILIILTILAIYSEKVFA